MARIVTKLSSFCLGKFEEEKTILHFQIDSGWMIQKKAKVDSQVGLGGKFWGTNQQV